MSADGPSGLPLTEQAARPADRSSAVHDSARAVTAVARVARALVGVGDLHELGDDALREISDALGLDRVAMYTSDADGLHVFRLFQIWPPDGAGPRATEFLPLTPEAWRFLVASAGPLVVRERDALFLENPFRPAAEFWMAIPLLAQERVVGAVYGISAKPIALGPVARATLGSIADVLSAGVATARLRMEVQRAELQRERMTLMGDLHDGLAQDLALAVREISFLETHPPPDALAASSKRLSEAVRAAHRVARAGLDDLAAGVPEPGVVAAIEAVSDRYRRRGLSVEVEKPVPTATADATVLAVLIRVLNESLANVERHAGAGSAAVSVLVDGATLVLRVRDEGVGFDPARLPGLSDGHFGVTIMRQRAASVGGELSVTAALGRGTSVSLRVPLTEQARA